MQALGCCCCLLHDVAWVALGDSMDCIERCKRARRFLCGARRELEGQEHYGIPDKGLTFFATVRWVLSLSSACKEDYDEDIKLSQLCAANSSIVSCGTTNISKPSSSPLTTSSRSPRPLQLSSIRLATNDRWRQQHATDP